VLVQQDPGQQRERVAAEQLVGRGVLGDAELGLIAQCAAARP
jgi:hypothetical protein